MARSASPSATNRARGELLVDREIAALLGHSVRGVESAPRAAQVQPASLDLRLGRVAHAMRASFLPGRTPIAERLAELETERIALERGAVLERQRVYLVPLEEELALAPDVWASFNPRSSTGRCDVFARVLADGHPRFDAVPAGWHGRLWLELSPLSFPVRVARGDALAQARFGRGDPALSAAELEAEYARTPLCWIGERPLPASEVRFDGTGGLELHLGLAGRDPCGWRARPDAGVLALGGEGANDPRVFFEPVHARNGRALLAPGAFHLFASRERVRVPPHFAAEMVPVDVGIGEMRNNYAGFFDTGFGERAGPAPGTPAVLEVRAHDVPFLVEDGQVFFRLRYFRTSGRPERLYGEGRGSYADQALTLARCFRPV